MKPSGKPTLPALVIIGISAGGPGTLIKLLELLPSAVESALIIVQHFEKSQSLALVKWLASCTSRPVVLARHGETVVAGGIYLCPSDGDTEILPAGCFISRSGDLSSPYTPSINRIFKSLVRYPAPILAIVMTGMGEDGALGLLELRQAGVLTIAQDESSSIINGMPRAAIRINAAQRVLDIGGIATAIRNFGLYPKGARYA